MKKFFEEYGFIILICVVVISLVGIAIGIKPLMADSISNITSSWGSEAKESLNDAWSEDGSSSSQEQDKTQVTPISKTKSYIGKYADINCDGTVDGIIFADFAFDKSGTYGTGTEYAQYGSYSYTAETTELKDYYVSQASYTGAFGTAEVIAPVSGKRDGSGVRFYVMFLQDHYATGINNTCNWYYSAKDYNEVSFNISEYYSTIKDEFGAGQLNTEEMLYLWSNEILGSRNTEDIWSAIGDRINQAYDFVPSRAQWAAFADAFGITSLNYEQYGLNSSYWSSTPCIDYCAYATAFSLGGIINNGFRSDCHVRLMTFM